MYSFSRSKLKLVVVGIASALLVFASGPQGSTQQDSGGDDFDGVDQFASISVDSALNLDAYSEAQLSYDEYDEIDGVGTVASIDQDGSYIYSESSEDPEDAVVEIVSEGSIPSGHEYGNTGMAYACIDDGEEDGDCDYEYLGDVYVSVDVASTLPQITSVSPQQLALGTSGTMTVNGVNLVDSTGANPTPAYADQGIAASVQSATPTKVVANYYIGTGANTGTYDFTLTTDQGTSNAVPVTIGYPPATITSVSPNTLIAGQTTTLTINGSNFGTAPTASITGTGVQGTSTVSASPTQIVVSVTVAVDAPTGPVTVQVQPGYTGSTFTCGCSGSGAGSSQVSIQAVAPPIHILFGGNDITNATGVQVFAGQQISLQVPTPSGFVAPSCQWSLQNNADVVGGFTNSAGTGGPSGSGGGKVQGAVLAGASVTNYFIVPNSQEVFTASCTFENSTSASATAGFSIAGPSGNTTPQAFTQTDKSSTTVFAGNPESLSMDNAPGMPNVGIWFNDLATLPSGQAMGSFIWVQLINATNYSQIQNIPPNYKPPMNVTAGLDGQYPYPSTSGSVVTSDQPARLDLYSQAGEMAEQFDATMYVLWDPAIPPAGQSSCVPASVDTSTMPYTPKPSTCSSIPIPLSSIRWEWSGCAINAAAAGSAPSFSVYCGAAQAFPAQSAGYPQWSTCDHSKNGGCQ